MNMVSSKALLRWHLLNTTAFDWAAKGKLLARLGGRLTKEGDLLISSQRHRDQPRNQEDCRQKLTALIAEALRPVKARKATKPTHGSELRRRDEKKRRSLRKTQRRGMRGDE